MSDPIPNAPYTTILIAFVIAVRSFSPVFVASRIRRPIHVGPGTSPTYQETEEGKPPWNAASILTTGVPDESKTVSALEVS
ncbi:hypothetical protein DICSQDRAFT_171553 [Dichomitus squalens LYAD-421 SS1]|uniref:Uncharacterized protein n=1 Tax=Dichomitus squalens (strain LYAD-421) TaxID=732165 RepID=R7SVV4_DICSQ|nr:uncharacterized protein DICSQDRAFT_171553 [Dichomitus squalens LYAD-421 SS1]EJF60068.1 hypothetical protein DICSQDRAFT_171553 [Dichomitus squalens LYAD-421 SS1]